MSGTSDTLSLRRLDLFQTISLIFLIFFFVVDSSVYDHLLHKIWKTELQEKIVDHQKKAYWKAAQEWGKMETRKNDFR